MTTHRRREAAAAAHHPARAAHRPGDRPGHQRAHRRTRHPLAAGTCALSGRWSADMSAWG